jgi:ABC-2 type transport system ATP-binding protein
VAEALRLLEHQPFVREATIDEGTVRLYVERGEAAMPLILRLLDGGGLTLQTISLARPSLDDVFLRQTGRSLRDEAA